MTTKARRLALVGLLAVSVGMPAVPAAAAPCTPDTCPPPPCTNPNECPPPPTDPKDYKKYVKQAEKDARKADKSGTP